MDNCTIMAGVTKAVLKAINHGETPHLRLRPDRGDL